MAISATGTTSYFQYLRQSQQVNAQSQDIQINNQNKQTDTIIRQNMANHVKNDQNIMRVRQFEGSRGSIVDLTA